MSTVHTTTTYLKMNAAFLAVDQALRVLGVFDAHAILMIFKYLWICSQTHQYLASFNHEHAIFIKLCNARFYANFTDKAYPAAYFPWQQMPPAFDNYSNCAYSNKQAILDDQQSYTNNSLLSQEAMDMH